jgi:homocysteine S-methyltransferase
VAPAASTSDAVGGDAPGGAPPGGAPLAGLLRSHAVVILDGALATELERRGADLADPLWSAKCLVEQPDLIREVHLDYFKAGAQVATTATYQATFEGFAKRGIDRGAASRLMREAVALARAARDEFCASASPSQAKPLVAASVGPYGAMLADGSEYRGRYGVSDRALADFHRSRLEVLARSGADLLAIETLPCLREALVLAELLREHPGIAAWVCFSCQDGARNCEGEKIEACAKALDAYPQIAAVGVNCTAPKYVLELLARMREQTAKPLAAYPNSGQHYQPFARKWVGSSSHASLAGAASNWNAAGARLIGGCCRTTPADIRELCRALGRAPESSAG